MIRYIYESERSTMEYKTEEIIRKDNIVGLTNGDWIHRHLLTEFGKINSFFVCCTIYNTYGEEKSLYSEAKWSDSRSEAERYYNSFCETFSCERSAL